MRPPSLTRNCAIHACFTLFFAIGGFVDSAVCAEDAIPPADTAPATETSAQASKATPLNPAIFVGGWRPLRGPIERVDAAADHGHRRLNVVVTVFVDLTKDLHIKNFGQMRGKELGYQPYDEATRQQLKESLRETFARMVEHGMAIYILPHIDAGGEVQEWRNWVDFDPQESYGGYSYEHLLLDTIAAALAETIKPDTHVEFALSGEMGTSLFRYPVSYQKIIEHLRARPELAHVRIGMSLNHNKIAGEENPSGAADIQLSGETRQQLQDVINSCDFVGMSFYRPVSLPPQADDFVRGVNQFMSEFERYGLQVPTSKPLHFSEVGIGGGHEEGDSTSDPAKAVESPWAGTADPRQNPWRNAEMIAMRRQYHEALLSFLAKQPARWRVSAAFLWSMGSWNPLDGRRGDFTDPEIVAAVEKHNYTSAGN